MLINKYLNLKKENFTWSDYSIFFERREKSALDFKAFPLVFLQNAPSLPSLCPFLTSPLPSWDVGLPDAWTRESHFPWNSRKGGNIPTWNICTESCHYCPGSYWEQWLLFMSKALPKNKIQLLPSVPSGGWWVSFMAALSTMSGVCEFWAKLLITAPLCSPVLFQTPVLRWLWFVRAWSPSEHPHTACREWSTNGWILKHAHCVPKAYFWKESLYICTYIHTLMH